MCGVYINTTRYDRTNTEDSRCLVTHCLLSYPRSGNHWTRYIIEALTDRPTYGCGPDDRPIYTNIWKQKSVLPSVAPLAQPAAQKMHFVEPKSKGCSTHNSYCSHLIFIQRDPHETIPRNIGRSKPWSKSEVSAAVDHYISLINYYERFTGPKLHISYERLMETPHKVILELARHIGASTETAEVFLRNIDDHIERSTRSSGKSWYGSISNRTAKAFHWERIDQQKQRMLLDALKYAIY